MARRVKINSNPNKTPAKGKRNPTQQDIYEKELRDVRQDKLGSKESSSKKTIKVNSNPNKTPAKKQSTWSWSEHAWNSREGTGKYGQPTFDNKKKVDNIKVNSNPVKAGKTKVSPMAKVRKPSNFRGRGGGRGGVIGGGFLDQIK